MVKPALQGTKGVLKACTEAGTVKRLVITSSVAAIGYPLQKDYPADSTFDESWWTNLEAEGLHPYRKAKTLAEKAAWDYQAQLSDDKKFEIVAICPSFIMGPSVASGDALSEGFAKGIVTGTTQSLTKKAMGFVDVRDCALAHLNGVKVEEAKNKRFLLSGESLWFREAAQIIADEYGPKGYPVT